MSGSSFSRWPGILAANYRVQPKEKEQKNRGDHPRFCSIRLQHQLCERVFPAAGRHQEERVIGETDER